MTPPSQDADPLIGQTISSYRILEKIGAGGMGSVYLAEQPTIGARVAIKVLSHQDARDARAVQRLFAEARAVNVIRHERIVNILDLATLPDGRPAVVMEHLRGQPLSTLIAERGPLPLASFASLMREVLAGLGAAHEQGIVHRDLKPANIFVSPEGHAKLLDFGIAKFIDEPAAARLTAAGFVLGTLPYMAPEQAVADPVDGRTDVFAAGAVLYEGATGVRPFVGRNLPTLCEEHARGPTRPREVRPSIPQAYEAVILRAMAADPRDRFASAAEMAKALDRAGERLPDAEKAPLLPPIPTGPPGEPPTVDLRRSRPPAQPSPPASPRSRIAVTFTVLVTVLLATAAAVYFLALRSPSPATTTRDPARKPQPAKRRNTASTPTPARDAAPENLDDARSDPIDLALDPPPRALDPAATARTLTAHVRDRVPGAYPVSLSFTGLGGDGAVHLDDRSVPAVTYVLAVPSGDGGCRELTIDVTLPEPEIAQRAVPCEELPEIRLPRCTGRELAERAARALPDTPVDRLLFVYRTDGQWAVQSAQERAVRIDDDCIPAAADQLE